MISAKNHWSVYLATSLEQLVIATLSVELLVANGIWSVVANVRKEVLIEVKAPLVGSRLLLPLGAHPKNWPELSQLMHLKGTA